MTTFIDPEGLEQFPFVIIGVCSDGVDNWYVAGESREKAQTLFAKVAPNFKQPLYRINAMIKPERLKVDLALLRMSCLSESRN